MSLGMYVHADVKGSNLLTGFGPGRSHEVYLVDYGLAYRYNPDGKHKDYKEDPRKAKGPWLPWRWQG